MKRKSLSLVELVAALTIIGLFMGTMLIFIHKTTLIGKETILQIELKNIRSTINLHRIVKGSYPKDLRELIQARYKPKGSNEVYFSEKFLNTVGKDSEGYLIDPFGNRFYYNPQEGVVASTTKGYRNW